MRAFVLLALFAAIAAAGVAPSAGSRTADECPFLESDGAANAMHVTGTPEERQTFTASSHLAGWGIYCTFKVDDALGPRAMTASLTNPGHGLAFLKKRAHAMCAEDKTLCVQMEKAIDEDDAVRAMSLFAHGLAEIGAVGHMLGFGGNPALVWSAKPGGKLSGSLAYVFILKKKGELLKEKETRFLEVFCYRLRFPNRTADPACVEHAAHLIYQNVIQA